MTLTLATGPVLLDDEGESLRRRLAMRLVDSLHRPVAVVPTRTYAEVAAMIARGDAQLAWLPPAIFVRAEADPGVRVLAAVERSRGAGYRGVLFAPAAAPIHELSDLEGSRVAWVDRDSCAGHLFPRLALRQRGLEPSELFGEEIFAGSHGSAVRAVMNGDADVGATHAQTLDDGQTLMLAGWQPYAGNDGMRPLLVTDPIPSDVICAAADLDDETRGAVREALLSLHDAGEELLDELFGGPRLVPASSDDYEPVRAAMKK
ncbi:MAG TPA: phosphate/phosphite/phosphonate ABC transporter substrate-binding protein [Sandaracinaceae bacterium LLY-WYZ-13_1]|nr:phosphate/phosphite/phosphonate ABC transporter substrate-binding protein [Sandaracinaceae bacterium LLY-WYZ-13_1]